eukprot:TRINITY_DN758_c1_g2_i1.p1 TRINITY_DN758_c1_g2~~TRINITY_DN758_c1_g2_i1.p1  ORF type:complete len:444 (-),score=108.97 TRINITY_DN758_c1_g2_i1:200-1531(-)
MPSRKKAKTLSSEVLKSIFDVFTPVSVDLSNADGSAKKQIINDFKKVSSLLSTFTDEKEALKSSTPVVKLTHIKKGVSTSVVCTGVSAQFDLVPEDFFELMRVGFNDNFLRQRIFLTIGECPKSMLDRIYRKIAYVELGEGPCIVHRTLNAILKDEDKFYLLCRSLDSSEENMPMDFYELSGGEFSPCGSGTSMRYVTVTGCDMEIKNLRLRQMLWTSCIHRMQFLSKLAVDPSYPDFKTHPIKFTKAVKNNPFFTNMKRSTPKDCLSLGEFCTMELVSSLATPHKLIIDDSFNKSIASAMKQGKIELPIPTAVPVASSNTSLPQQHAQYYHQQHHQQQQQQQQQQITSGVKLEPLEENHGLKIKKTFEENSISNSTGSDDPPKALVFMNTPINDNDNISTRLSLSGKGIASKNSRASDSVVLQSMLSEIDERTDTDTTVMNK